MARSWKSVFTVLVVCAAAGSAFAAERTAEEASAADAVNKARLTGSFYVPEASDGDAYCAKVSMARLSGSFFVPNGSPKNCDQTQAK